MSKALVIKSADFSVNRVEQITLEDAVECTGITLNKNAVNLNDLTVTETLLPAVTPSDCTQPVIWTTSDNNVATVSNGVVTPVRLGSATITATCGSYSANCTVSVDNVILDSGFTFATVTNENGKNYASFSAPGGYVRITYADRIPQNSPRLRLGLYNVTTDYYLAPHVFPKGTSKINVKSNGLDNSYSCYVFFFASEEVATAAGLAKMIEKLTQNATNHSVDYTVDVPDGSDSFVAMVYTQSTYTETDNVDTVASNIGFEITYTT